MRIWVTLKPRNARLKAAQTISTNSRRVLSTLDRVWGNQNLRLIREKVIHRLLKWKTTHLQTRYTGLIWKVWCSRSTIHWWRKVRMDRLRWLNLVWTVGYMRASRTQGTYRITNSHGRAQGVAVHKTWSRCIYSEDSPSNSESYL